jgi:hypothetical protein
MLQLEHFHFDTPISEPGACQHCNYHSQATVLEQAQESEEANLGSHCREVLLKIKLGFPSLIESCCVDTSVINPP